MGEKDYQQFFLVQEFIEKKYKTKVYSCANYKGLKYGCFVIQK